MLHALTNETKQQNEAARPRLALEPERDIHPLALHSSVLQPLPRVAGTVPDGRPPGGFSQRFPALQRTFGNQAALDMLDSFSRSRRRAHFGSASDGVLQRKCSGGGSGESRSECSECRGEKKKSLQDNRKHDSPVGMTPSVRMN